MTSNILNTQRESEPSKTWILKEMLNTFQAITLERRHNLSSAQPISTIIFTCDSTSQQQRYLYLLQSDKEVQI